MNKLAESIAFNIFPTQKWFSCIWKHPASTPELFCRHCKTMTEKVQESKSPVSVLSLSFRITQLRLETSIFIVLRNHQNQLIRFPANHLIDCDTHAECYFTGSMREINSIISNRDHNQIAMIVGYGKGYDESEGWYPKAFHKFDNGTMDKFTESVSLLQYHKTISSIIGEMSQILEIAIFTILLHYSRISLLPTFGQGGDMHEWIPVSTWRVPGQECYLQRNTRVSRWK